MTRPAGSQIPDVFRAFVAERAGEGVDRSTGAARDRIAKARRDDADPSRDATRHPKPEESDTQYTPRRHDEPVPEVDPREPYAEGDQDR